MKTLLDRLARCAAEAAKTPTDATARELARLSCDFFEAMDRGEPLPVDDATPIVWPKRCPSCGAVYSESQWNSLALRGYVGAFQAHGEIRCVELRDCTALKGDATACNSTIGIEVPMPLARPVGATK